MNNKKQNKIPNGWEVKKLGEIGEIVTGNTPPKKDLDNYGTEFCWATAEDFVSKYIFDTKVKMSKKGKVFSRFLPKNSILVTCIASIGKNAIAKVPLATNQQINSIVVNDKNDYQFIYYLINISSNTLKKYAGGGALLMLNKLDFSKIKFNFPPLPEQKRIVSVLEVWDEVLEKLKRKIEIKKNIKKGLMQELLTGKRRINGFGGGWAVKELGNVFDNIGGTSLEKFVNKKAEHKFISIGNYTKDGKYIDNGQRIELNEKTKTKLLDKDNLVMVLNDKTHAGDIIGSSILVDGDKYIYNQRSERLICDRNIILPIFAWYYLNSKEIRKKVFSISQGGTQIYVNFPSVKKIILNLPSLEEQKAIADILMSADDELEELLRKQKLLEDQKKYLLNNLISGEIRTPDNLSTLIV